MVKDEVSSLVVLVFQIALFDLFCEGLLHPCQVQIIDPHLVICMHGRLFVEAVSHCVNVKIWGNNLKRGFVWFFGMAGI
jgi:hypothetical protein